MKPAVNTIQTIINIMEDYGYTLAVRNTNLYNDSMIKFKDLCCVFYTESREPWVLTNSLEVITDSLKHGDYYEVDHDKEEVKYTNEYGVVTVYNFDNITDRCNEDQEFIDISDLRFYCNIQMLKEMRGCQ